MLGVFRTNNAEALQKELLKDNVNEEKIEKYISAGVDINKKDTRGRTLLFSLIAKRKVDAIKILLKNGADINIEDNYGKTVLEEAIYKEDNMMIRFILEQGASLDKINSSGRTLMQDVALEGNGRIFSLLMKYSPNLDTKDSYGKTVLFDAIEGANLEIVKEILNNIEDINVLDSERKSILFHAVFKEDTEITKYLINFGVDVNIVDINKQNILFNAIVMGSSNLDVIELLVDYEIKLNVKDVMGKTILDELLKILTILKNIKPDDKKLKNKYRFVNHDRNYLKLTKTLVDSGLAIDRVYDNGKTLLSKEVEDKNYERIEFLLESGASIDAGDKYGRTVLFDAVLKGDENQEMIDYLVEKGADYDHIDNDERSIVDEICEIILIQDNNKKQSSTRFLGIDKTGDYYALLKNFLIFRPNINYQKKDGRTVLFDIIKYNNLDLIKMLFNAGIDPNIVDKDRKTPLTILVEDGLEIKRIREKELFLERLVFFLKFRVLVDNVDKNGRSVYHKAVLAGDYEVVEKLLTKKSNLNLKDKQGRTALHHTQWKGDYKLARLLITAGSDIDAVDNAGFSLLNYSAILGQTKLIVVLIASGVLMYNKAKKSKVVAKYFKDNEKNLDKLLEANMSDEKMKQSIIQVVENLRSEVELAIK